MSNKEKILILGDINSIHLQKWVDGLTDEFDIALFSLSELSKENKLTNRILKNAQVKLSNSNLVFLKPFQFFIAILKLWFFYFKIKPKIVHAHYATSYGLLGRLLFHKKYFISVWGSDVFEFPIKSKFHTFLFKWIIKGASNLFSTSHIMKKELSIYTTKRIEVVPFGVDVQFFKKDSSELKTDDKFIVGTIKKLESIYGIDRLIESFYLFQLKFPNSECHIYGEGSEKEELKTMVEKYKLQDKIFFKGFISHDLVPEKLLSFDVFCALSRYESFGVSIVEASSSSLPVIVTNIGGLPEVVNDGKSGYVIEYSKEIVAEKLLKLANDMMLRETMGKEGRLFVLEKYDWEQNLAQMIHQYNSEL